MSEEAPKNIEAQKNNEALSDFGEQLKHKLERESKNNETETDDTENLEQLREKIEAKSITTQEKAAAERESPAPSSHPVYENKHLKDTMYHRALVRARKKLKAPDRLLSKAIHIKGLEELNEAASKTVARPSSMLGGAFFAFVGTSALLWITRHYGYEYNYLAVILLFGIGMVIGVGVELLYKFIKKTRA